AATGRDAPEGPRRVRQLPQRADLDPPKLGPGDPCETDGGRVEGTVATPAADTLAHAMTARHVPNESLDGEGGPARNRWGETNASLCRDQRPTREKRCTRRIV